MRVSYVIIKRAVLLGGLGIIWGQEIRQIIPFHNAADPYLQSIELHPEVYPNPTPLILTFRQSTTPVQPEGPSGAPVTLYWVRQGQVISQYSVSMPPANTRNFFIVRGVYNPAQFAPNPDGQDISFSHELIQLPSSPPPPNKFALVPYNGVTDMPKINYELDGSIIFSQAAYKDFGSPVQIDAGQPHTLTLFRYSNNQSLGSFSIQPSQLPGGTEGILLTSGFLNPAANQNGPVWGVFLVHSTGAVYQLQTISTALSQERSQMEAQVFSEPGAGEWILRLSSPVSRAISYRVVNTLGQEILRDEIFLSAGTWFVPISTASFPAGLYLLEIERQIFPAIK